MAKRITEQQVTTGIEDSDALATGKSAEDYQASALDLANYTLGKLTANDVLSLLLTVDSNTSELNSNFLQGNDAAFFRNAANLNTGTIPDARLPTGSLTENNGVNTSRNVIQFPEVYPGFRFMIQFGHTQFLSPNEQANVTFTSAFASGFGTSNKPIILLSPECDSSVSSPPQQRVETDVRLISDTVSLTGFSAAAIRTAGSGTDTARANYIAFGRY